MATLTITPHALPKSGGNVTISWSGIPSPSGTDWIGFYTTGTPDTGARLFWVYINTGTNDAAGTGTADGSRVLMIPASFPAGTHDARLFANNTLTRLAETLLTISGANVLQPGEKARMYALGAIMRGGASRGAYVGGGAFISIGGGYPRVLLDSLTITDVLDETPNRCTFRTDRSVPTIGQPVRVTLGSKNSGTPLFAGHVLTVNQSYVGDKPANVQAEVNCTDYTWQFGFALVTKRYRNLSCSTIAADLVATYAPGFTAKGIALGLPVLEEITYTNESLDGALTRLARRMGGYWYVDYAKDVHLFFTEDRGGHPVTLTPSHPSLSNFSSERDRSQCLTRVYVEGRGSRVLTDVQAGDTKIPVESADVFTAGADVFLQAAFSGSAGGAQRLTFSGVVPGGGGTLVGPGIGPNSPLTLTGAAGGLIESGTHDYVVRFVTASGESLVSPLTRTTLGPFPNPTTPPHTLATSPTFSPMYAFTVTIGDTLHFAYTYEMHGGGTTLNTPNSPPITTVSNQDPFNPLNSAPVSMLVKHPGDARVKWIAIYMHAASRAANGYRLILRVPASPGYTGDEQISTNGCTYGVTTLPGANTSGQNQITVSTIPVGGPGVTARRLYRSAANAGQLKLLTTIGDNTTTTYADNTPDASLGANMAPGDTSGLLQPSGQVVAGSNSIPVSGTFAFDPTGGWAMIGNGDQLIRYSETTGGNLLIGIPILGPGAIVASIAYNSTITAVGMLTGIPATGPGAIQETLIAGGELYTVVQTDDVARQTELAAAMGGSGIREEWIQDRRLSMAECRARGLATLAWRPLDGWRVRYDCRDLRTAAGKNCPVALDPPTNVYGTLKIQSVTIHNFRPYPNQLPTYSVEASSARFSFEDWLRVMRTKD